MFKIFVQLYKSVELNVYKTNKLLVLKMSEYKKEMVRSAIVAVLIVALLSGFSYHFFPQSRLPRVPFVFGWAEGDTKCGNAEYKNQTLDWDGLEFEFTFVNGSSIHEPDTTISLEYHGEFNATSLQRIAIGMFHLGIGSSPENVTYHLEIDKNTTISASLETVETTDLGAYEYMIGRSIIAYTNSCVQIFIRTFQSSYSGYWKRPGSLMIDINQLSSVLPDSGTVWITFDATLSVNVRYEITIEGTTETGETILSWEGTIGAIEISCDQGRIIWVKYDFQGISLVLFTISE